MTRYCLLPLVALVAACMGTEATDNAPNAYTPEVNKAADVITADGLMQHTRDLAADSMEGRGPGTRGEEMATAYLEAQFKALGLAPGNPDGSYIQKVDLIGYTSRPTLSFTIPGHGHEMVLKWPADFVASSRHDRAETKVAGSDVVFVGYGVVAPEYGWDDYKGVDVTGKTVVMLINDPAVKNADGSMDTTMFKGRAMTYYGRWTYKYEIATQKGAAAVLIVHETEPAAYGFDVVQQSFGKEQFDVLSPDASKRVPVEGWLSLDAAKHLFEDAKANFDSLHTAATTKEFRPFALNAKANATVKISVRRTASKNVVAKLEGGAKKDEYVVYTAHWDHLGRDSTVKGDQIWNGALDNASGTGVLLQIAKAFKALPTPPERSVLFLSVTAEEKGLLGAKYYAKNPLYPHTRTAANINMDGINQWGKTSDFTVIGLGNSTLDDIITSVLAQESRTVRPDAEPEKGYYYRSDHFEFAKEGVPALYTNSGTNYVGKPEGYSKQKRDEYTKNDYHKVTDEIKPDWDLAGAVDDTRVLFRVGYIVSQQAAMPEWKAGTEFKAKRDAAMKQ